MYLIPTLDYVGAAAKGGHCGREKMSNQNLFSGNRSVIPKGSQFAIQSGRTVEREIKYIGLNLAALNNDRLF